MVIPAMQEALRIQLNEWTQLYEDGAIDIKEMRMMHHDLILEFWHQAGDVRFFEILVEG
jgi:hypothetical protein